MQINAHSFRRTKPLSFGITLLGLSFLVLSGCGDQAADQKTFMTCMLAVSVINYRPAVEGMNEYSHGAGKKIWDSITPENGPVLVKEIQREHSGYASKREAFTKDYNSTACRKMHGQPALER